MKKLNFPKYSFRTQKEKDYELIFNEIRKSWVRLTPEEWVRQHVIFFLVDQRGFPASLIAVEKEILVQGRKKRFDIVCYDESHEPFLLVECKAPEVKVNENTLAQALRYNSVLQSKYVVITNGVSLYTASLNHQENKVEYNNDIPYFQ